MTRAEYHRGDTNLREMYRLVLERRSQSVVDRREGVTSLLLHLAVYISYTSLRFVLSPSTTSLPLLLLSLFLSLSLSVSVFSTNVKRTPFR